MKLSVPWPSLCLAAQQARLALPLGAFLGVLQRVSFKGSCKEIWLERFGGLGLLGFGASAV